MYLESPGQAVGEHHQLGGWLGMCKLYRLASKHGDRWQSSNQNHFQNSETKYFAHFQKHPAEMMIGEGIDVASTSSMGGASCQRFRWFQSTVGFAQASQTEAWKNTLPHAIPKWQALDLMFGLALFVVMAYWNGKSVQTGCHQQLVSNDKNGRGNLAVHYHYWLPWTTATCYSSLYSMIHYEPLLVTTLLTT